MLRRHLMAGLLSLAVVPRVMAQDPGAEPIVVTHHSVAIAGRTLVYTARAGRIPIRDNESGDVHGQMFFVSYTLDRPANAPPRPITFAWNGGPGSNAALVHLIGFGPKRIAPPPGARASDERRWIVEPNPGTWFDETDLVFVDPIGTGYSRPTKPEYGAEFYNTRGDAESVAEFIRVYRRRYGAEDAPLFLAGESFGVTRAAGVADALERRGTNVRGVILLGLALPLGSTSDMMRTALALPTLTVAAFTHKKLAPELQRDLQNTLGQAGQWATGEYAPALMRKETLGDSQRTAIIRGLSRFTGLDASSIDRNELVVDRMQLGNSLLRREGKVVGQYDVRMTAPLDTTPGPYDPNKDPSLQHLLDPVSVLRYLRGELGYRSDLNYQGPWGGGYPPPTRFRGDWMSVRWNWAADTATDGAQPAGTAGVGPRRAPPRPLETAMAGDPSLRVLIACGIYDLVCDAFGNEWGAAHLADPLRRNVVVKSYGGGHAMYTDPRAHLELKRDVRQFIRETLSSGASAAHGASQTTNATPRTTNPTQPATVAEPSIATRHYRITLTGKPFSYTVHTGLLPIMHNDDGSVRANMFYVAYVADRTPSQAPRPLTFAWNGGPGANSLLLHLSALGPRRLDSGDGGSSVRTPPRLVDNQETWLDVTDLVFVDPVGTGFSRPADPKYAEDFYGVLEDVAATREFIRTYRNRFDGWDAPVYLAGESYGTWRAAGTAEAMEKSGEHVAGVILISGGIPVGPLASDAMRAALFLPTRVATAAYHRKLATELQQDRDRGMKEAEDWGRSVYAPGLARRDSLAPAERAEIVVRLARYTGLDTSAVNRTSLVVDRQFLLDNLLKDRGQGRLGRFDTRQIAGSAAMNAEAAEEPLRRALTNQYLRDVLGFETDLVYQGLETGYASSSAPRDPNESWKWDQGDPGAPLVMNSDGPPGGTPPWVQRTFALNHSTRTFVAAGLYDSLNSCPLIAYQVSRLEPVLRANVSVRCYEGGHMMYEDRAARVQLKRDITTFYRAH